MSRCIARTYENSLYNQLLKRIENGETLNWNKITKRDLYFLNIVERVTDQEIGELFGVSMEECRKKRNRNNINTKWNESIDEYAQEVERDIWEAIRNSHRKMDFDMYYRILDAIHHNYNVVAI